MVSPIGFATGKTISIATGKTISIMKLEACRSVSVACIWEIPGNSKVNKVLRVGEILKEVS